MATRFSPLLRLFPLALHSVGMRESTPRRDCKSFVTVDWPPLLAHARARCSATAVSPVGLGQVNHDVVVSIEHKHVRASSRRLAHFLPLLPSRLPRRLQPRLVRAALSPNDLCARGARLWPEGRTALDDDGQVVCVVSCVGGVGVGGGGSGGGRAERDRGGEGGEGRLDAWGGAGRKVAVRARQRVRASKEVRRGGKRERERESAHLAMQNWTGQCGSSSSVTVTNLPSPMPSSCIVLSPLSSKSSDSHTSLVPSCTVTTPPNPTALPSPTSSLTNSPSVTSGVMRVGTYATRQTAQCGLGALRGLTSKTRAAVRLSQMVRARGHDPRRTLSAW